MAGAIGLYDVVLTVLLLLVTMFQTVITQDSTGTYDHIIAYILITCTCKLAYYI